MKPVTGNWLSSQVKKVLPPSIRNNIILPYALLTLVLAMVGTYIVTWLVAGTMEERFVNQLISAGRVVSSEIVSYERIRLNVARQVIRTSGIAPAAHNQDWERVQRLTYPIMITNLEVDHIVVIDATGQEQFRFYRLLGEENTVVTSTTKLEYQDDWTTWPPVVEVLNDPANKARSVGLVVDPITGEMLIYTVAAIQLVPDSNEVEGAVLIGHYLKKQLDLFKSQNDNEFEVILFGPSPAIPIYESTISLTSEDKASLHQIFTPEEYDTVKESQGNIVLFDQLNTQTNNYRLAYAPYITQDEILGVFGVAAPTNFITDSTAQNRNLLAIVMTIGMGVVFLAGFAIANNIINRVKRLVAVTQAVASGDLTQRTGLDKGEDEIAVLATNFDDMTAKLQQKTIQLEEEASKLKAILTSIADGVIVQDVSGGILTKNPASEKILQAIGETLEAEGKTALDDALKQLLDSLADLEYLEQRRLEMGERVVSALSSPVKTSTEELLGSVVVLRDITQEVIAERLKDKFIQSVSHELKTPMFPLTGSISLIKMMLPMIQAQVPEKIFEKLLHNTNVADEQANDIKNVVMAMVDLSEIDADNFAINRETMNLTDIVEQVAQDWYGPMEEKGLELDILLPSEAIWVNADEEKMRQVIKTLLKNSHDYTLEGNVEVTMNGHNGRAEVIIKDTGVGILEKDQPYLFSRFYRAIHDKKTFELSGIGLGLYLSKVILERQNGEIWMESQPYGGSTFSFALPIVEPPAPTDDDDWDPWGDEEGGGDDWDPWDDEEGGADDDAVVLLS